MSAKKELKNIQSRLFGKELRTFSKLEMIKFARLCQEEVGIDPLDRIREFVIDNPELTPEDKLKNLRSVLGDI